MRGACAVPVAEEPMEILVFIGFMVAIIAASVAGARYAARKRAEAWMAVAPRMELTYHSEIQLASAYPGFKSFSLGHSRRSPNLLQGASGSVRVMLGDYQYTTGSGKNSHTHTHTVCILERDGLDLPHCFMRPQSFLDALGKVFGGQDIDFAEDPDFSKTFVLQGEDEGAIRSRFDRPSRDWLVAHKDQFVRFEAKGTTIAFFAPRMKPELAPKVLDAALDFLMRWAG